MRLHHAYGAPVRQKCAPRHLLRVRDGSPPDQIDARRSGAARTPRPRRVRSGPLGRGGSMLRRMRSGATGPGRELPRRMRSGPRAGREHAAADEIQATGVGREHAAPDVIQATGVGREHAAPDVIGPLGWGGSVPCRMRSRPPGRGGSMPRLRPARRPLEPAARTAREPRSSRPAACDRARPPLGDVFARVPTKRQELSSAAS
jgi:hypothetical protein